MEWFHTRYRSSYITIFLIFLFFLLFHLTIPLTHVKDDQLLFFEPLRHDYNGNYFKFLAHRYSTWSSRLVIETFTLYSVTHFWFFRLINALMMTIASVLPAFFVRGSKTRTCDLLVSTALFCCIPLSLFYDTGWIATSTNYLWVYASALLASYSIWALLQKRCNKTLYIVGLLASIYTTNHEQMLPLFGTYSVLVLGYLVYRSDLLVARILPFLGITLANLGVILFSNGNQVRYASEVAQWFPDYEALSLFRKLELGFSSTVRHLFFDQLALPVVLLFVLALALYTKEKLSKLDYILPLIPIAISLFLTYNLFQFIPSTFREFFYAQFTQYGTTFQFSNFKTWIPELILLGITISILWCYLRVKTSFTLRIIWVLMFCAAIVVRMILAFSPTIWASSGRTYLFTLGLFSLLILSILNTIVSTRVRTIATFLLITIGLLAYLSQLYAFYTV